jgi:adenylate kinase
MLNIVIFGAPGSGKGTQSARIVEKYGLNHISTGDVLRAEIKNGTELGQTAKKYMDQGQLLPDELIIDILASTLDNLKDSKGVIEVFINQSGVVCLFDIYNIKTDITMTLE